MILANPWKLRLQLAKPMAQECRQAVRRRRSQALEKTLANSELAKWPPTRVVRDVLPEPQVKFAAPPDFSSVHDGKRCWPCSGAHKGPIAQR